MADDSSRPSAQETSDTATSHSATPDTATLNGSACNGQVNAGFEETEAPPKEENGEVKGAEVAEAVNLELVTMSPYTNSIPVKKESTELDMTDPYDEYFVPVNQHKKYIRGEKLYVTQDKRENLAGSKKKCCCGVITVIVLGAIIAILVGVVLTQDSMSESQGRNYNKGILEANLIPTPPPRTSPPPPLPTTDMSHIYLKNVLEGQLTIDNMEFTPGLSERSNPEFKTLATSLEEEIKAALFDHQTLHYGAADISVKVIEFRKGSVVVLYRIGWTFKEGIRGASDPINVESLKMKLQKHIRENDGFLYNYRVPSLSIKSNRVIDGCQMDNGECSHICLFNVTLLQITCSCPFGYSLDEDMKNCIISDHHHHTHTKEESDHTEIPNFPFIPPSEASPEPLPEYERENTSHEEPPASQPEPPFEPTPAEEPTPEHKPSFDVEPPHETSHEPVTLRPKEEEPFHSSPEPEVPRDSTEPPFEASVEPSHIIPVEAERHNIPIYVTLPPSTEEPKEMSSQMSTESSSPLPVSENASPERSEDDSAEKHMEYLPEYSTFPDGDSSNESQNEFTTPPHHLMPTSDEPPKKDEKEDEPVIIEITTKSNIQSLEHEHTTQGSSSEMKSNTMEAMKEHEMLLPVEVTRNTTEPSTTTHTTEVHADTMNDTENNTMIISENFDSTDKEKNYTEVMNHLQTVDAVKHEEMSTEVPFAMNKSVNYDSLLREVSTSERPAEDYNIIETFREAKATNFTNSTQHEMESKEISSDSKESESNKENIDNAPRNNESPIIVNIPIDFTTEAITENEGVTEKSTEPPIDVESKEKSEMILNLHPTEKDEPKEDVPATVSSPSLEETTVMAKSNEEMTEQPMALSELPTTTVSQVKTDDMPTKSTELPETLASDTLSLTSGSDTLSKETVPDSEEVMTEVVKELRHTDSQNPPNKIFQNKTEVEEKKEAEMPMISLTHIPDLEGPFPVEPHNEKYENNENTKPSHSEINSIKIDKLLNQSGNRLSSNSLDDDFENELKGSYLGKSKLIKDFHVKEVFNPNNSSEKIPISENNMNKENEHATQISESPVSEKVEDSKTPFFSEEAFTTIMPLFEPKTESIPSAMKTEGPTTSTEKETNDNSRFFSEEAFTTLSPLFKNTSGETTTMKSNTEKIITTTPLIIDLLGDSLKKVSATENNFESISFTEIPDKMEIKDSPQVTEVSNEYLTEAPVVSLDEVKDLMEEPFTENMESEKKDEEVKSMNETKAEENMESGKKEEMTTVEETKLEKNMESEKKEEMKTVEETRLEDNMESEKKEEMRTVEGTRLEDNMENMEGEKKEEMRTVEGTKLEENMEAEKKEEMKTMEGTKLEDNKESEKKEDMKLVEEATNNVTKNGSGTTEEIPPMTTLEINEMVTVVPGGEPFEEKKTSIESAVRNDEGMMADAPMMDPVVKLLLNTSYSKCASGQVECKDSSGCIAPNQRCDSVTDCADGSDEEDCQKQGCLDNFQCADKSMCLKRHLVCDTVPHCPDGSDEAECDNWKCKFDEVQCLPSSRQCIPALWKCNGVPDCPKNEDEIGCRDSCENFEYLCAEGFCIPSEKKCDGVVDCAKGEDELNCFS